MSTTVDQRIVQMQFDNRQFDSRVQGTVSSIDRLNRSLEFQGASRGFENINAAARGVNMDGIGNAVENVRLKFSALEVMAITALGNITNTVLNAGKKLVSAFTIDPIKQGFDEYETKINAIQTIMSNTSSKGTTMEDVTKNIDELNTYADKTIYNFAEMTRNIGTFTAAGVALEPATKAIQGIANLAAASGSNSQQASTAMYQLSQAMAAGKVQLMDWNSVVNAGMGGEKFQQALMTTAKQHGVAVDDMVAQNGSFRESLQEGWLSADILNETLNNFTVDGAKKYTDAMLASGEMTQEQADAMNKEALAMEDAATKVKTFTQLMAALKESAQSGWGKSWEIMIGDFEEAKVIFSGISDALGGIINASSDARNNLLQSWKTLGGRTEIIDAVKNTFQAFMIVINAISDAFRTIFPPVTGEQLVAFSTGLKDLTSKLKLSDENVEKLRNVFLGLFDVIQMITEVIGFLWDKLSPGVPILGKIAQFILDVASAFGLLLTDIDEIVYGVMSFDAAIKAFAERIGKAFTAVAEGIFGVSTETTRSIEKIKKPFEIVTKKVSGLGDVVKDVKKEFEKFIPTKFKGDLDEGDTKTKKLVTTIKRLSSGMEKNKTEIDKTSDSLSRMTKVTEGADSSTSQYTDTVSKIKEAMGKMKDAVANAIGEFDVNTWMGILGVGIFGILTIVIAKFTKVLSSPVDAFNDMIGAITGIFDRIEKIGAAISGVLDQARDSLKAYQNQINAKVLKAIAVAVAILAGALWLLSTIEIKKLAVSMGAVIIMITSLMGAMAMFKKWGTFDKEILVAIPVLLGLAVAIGILAIAMKVMGSMDIAQMGIALLGMGVMLGYLIVTIGAFKLIQMSTLTKTAYGLVVFAVALGLLAGSLVKIGQLSPEQLAIGLIGLAGLLGAVAAFTKLAQANVDLVPTGIAVLLIAMAMRKMVDALEAAGQLPWDQIGRGLVGLGGGLAIMIATMKLMPTDKMIRIGISLAIAAGGMWLIAQALKEFGSMTWDEMAIGIIAMGGAMLILAAGLNLMNGTLAGSAALMIAALALGILAPALLAFGKMAPEEIIKGFIVIAGVFGIFAAAALLLAPVIPVMALLAGVMVLMGIGIAGLGVGLFLVGAGFELLIAGLLLLDGISGEAVQNIIDNVYKIVTAIVMLIPTVATELANGLVAFAKVIIEGAPIIAEAVMTIFAELLILLTTMVPQLVEFFFTFLVQVCQAIAKYVPIIAQAVWDLILGILNVLAENIPKLIQAGVDIISAFVIGIGEAIPKLVDAATKAVIAFINGLAESIRENTPLMIDAINNLFDAIMEAGLAVIENAIPGFGEKGKSLMESGLVKGIGDFVGGIWSSIKGGLDGALEGAKGFIDKFLEVGGDIINGLINGIKWAIDGVINAAAGAAQAAIDASKEQLDSNSPSKVYETIGVDADKGLANGFVKGSKIVSKASAKVAEKAIDVASKTMSSLGNVIMNNIDVEPTIKPVMDLTSIQNGSKMMSNLFGDKSMKLATTAQATTSPQSVLDVIDKVVNSTVDSMMAALATEESTDTNVNISIPLTLDGREVAKVTAPYTLKEINKINKFKSNLGGAL